MNQDLFLLRRIEDRRKAAQLQSALERVIAGLCIVIVFAMVIGVLR